MAGYREQMSPEARFAAEHNFMMDVSQVEGKRLDYMSSYPIQQGVREGWRVSVDLGVKRENFREGPSYHEEVIPEDSPLYTSKDIPDSLKTERNHPSGKIKATLGAYNYIAKAEDIESTEALFDQAVGEKVDGTLNLSLGEVQQVLNESQESIAFAETIAQRVHDAFEMEAGREEHVGKALDMIRALSEEQKQMLRDHKIGYTKGEEYIEVLDAYEYALLSTKGSEGNFQIPPDTDSLKAFSAEYGLDESRSLGTFGRVVSVISGHWADYERLAEASYTDTAFMEEYLDQEGDEDLEKISESIRGSTMLLLTAEAMIEYLETGKGNLSFYGDNPVEMLRKMESFYDLMAGDTAPMAVGKAETLLKSLMGNSKQDEIFANRFLLSSAYNEERKSAYTENIAEVSSELLACRSLQAAIMSKRELDELPEDLARKTKEELVEILEGEITSTHSLNFD